MFEPPFGLQLSLLPDDHITQEQMHFIRGEQICNTIRRLDEEEFIEYQEVIVKNIMKVDELMELVRSKTIKPISKNQLQELSNELSSENWIPQSEQDRLVYYSEKYYKIKALIDNSLINQVASDFENNLEQEFNEHKISRKAIFEHIFNKEKLIDIIRIDNPELQKLDVVYNMFTDLNNKLKEAHLPEISGDNENLIYILSLLKNYNPNHDDVISEQLKNYQRNYYEAKIELIETQTQKKDKLFNINEKIEKLEKVHKKRPAFLYKKEVTSCKATINYEDIYKCFNEITKNDPEFLVFLAYSYTMQKFAKVEENINLANIYMCLNALEEFIVNETNKKLEEINRQMVDEMIKYLTNCQGLVGPDQYVHLENVSESEIGKLIMTVSKRAIMKEIINSTSKFDPSKKLYLKELVKGSYDNTIEEIIKSAEKQDVILPISMDHQKYFAMKQKVLECTPVDERELIITPIKLKYKTKK